MTKVIDDDKAVGVVGPTLSAQAFAADPIAQEKSIPVIGPSNTAAGIVEMGDFIFRDSLPESAVIPGTVKDVVSLLGVKKVGILWGNNDDFTAGGYQVFKTALADQNVDRIGRRDVCPRRRGFPGAAHQDHRPAARCHRRLRPGQGGRADHHPGAQPGLHRTDRGRQRLQFAVGDRAGRARRPKGVIVGAAWNIASQAPLSAGFIKAYQAAYNAPPDQFAAQAYTAVWLFGTAIRRADSTDPKAIRDALAGIQDLETPLGKFSFGPDRNPIHPPVVQIVRGGKFVVLTPETAAP